jgi:hypothetical protein
MVVKHKQTNDVFIENSTMIGEIDVPSTYQEYIDKIHEVFPLLTINPAAIYVMFEDPEVIRILMNKIGDGTGITSDAIQNCYTIQANWFQNNQNLELFNDFNKFINVTSLPADAFSGDTALREINISNIQTIGRMCFRNCTSLTKVIATAVTTINAFAFLAAGTLADSDFGHNITTIGEAAFKGAKFTDIDLSNATSIGLQTFNGCSNLTDIHTDLSNVTTIGAQAFDACQSLTGNCILNISQIPRQLFCNCKNITSVDISNCTSFEIYEWGGTFENCEKIKSFNLNPNVKQIGPRTFAGCISLETIDVSNVEEFVVKNNNTGMHFWGCTLLKQLTLNENVTSIPNDFCLGCVSLTEITIPANVTFIGNAAFFGCTGLTKITILPTTPPTLNNANAFNGTTCTIYVPASSVELYKTANNWSTYASRIQAIPT